MDLATAPITFAQYQRRSRELHARADALSKSILDEQRHLSIQAGLDPNLLGIHPHNAMCSYEDAKPWPGVDYALVRRIMYLQREIQFKPRRIVESVLGKLFKRIVYPGDQRKGAYAMKE